MCENPLVPRTRTSVVNVIEVLSWSFLPATNVHRRTGAHTTQTAVQGFDKTVGFTHATDWCSCATLLRECVHEFYLSTALTLDGEGGDCGVLCALCDVQCVHVCAPSSPIQRMSSDPHPAKMVPPVHACPARQLTGSMLCAVCAVSA